MHFFVYIFAALSLLGGAILAAQTQNDVVSTIYIFIGIYSGVMLATFGKIEEHLGEIREHIKNADARGVGVSSGENEKDVGSVGSKPPAKPSDVEDEGYFLGKWKYQKLADGTIKVRIGTTSKSFRSEHDAKEYLLRLQGDR